MNYQPQIAQNKLKEMRIAKGLTQARVAWHLGLDMVNRISYWEHGHSIPNITNLLKLCVLYETTPQEIYGSLIERIRSEVHPASGDLPPASPTAPNISPLESVLIDPTHSSPSNLHS